MALSANPLEESNVLIEKVWGLHTKPINNHFAHELSQSMLCTGPAPQQAAATQVEEGGGWSSSLEGRGHGGGREKLPGRGSTACSKVTDSITAAAAMTGTPATAAGSRNHFQAQQP